jgi:hypothetical protein
MSESREGFWQRASHIGQAAGFRVRDDFRSRQQNIQKRSPRTRIFRLIETKNSK